MRERARTDGQGEAYGEEARAHAVLPRFPIIDREPLIKRASGLISPSPARKDRTYSRSKKLLPIRERATRPPNHSRRVFRGKPGGIVRFGCGDRIDILPGAQTQPAESSLTELAGRMRNDGARRVATTPTPPRSKRSAPLPQLESPRFRPTARHPEGRRQRRFRISAPGLAGPRSVGRSSPVRKFDDENVLDIPAFLQSQGPTAP